MAKVTLSPSQSAILADFITAASKTGGFSSIVVTALSDGKLSGTEIIEIVINAPAVISAVKPLLSRLREWNYMEDEQKQQVVAAFAQYFDIANDVAEQAIEMLISSAVAIESALEKFVKGVKQLRKLPTPVLNGLPAGSVAV